MCLSVYSLVSSLRTILAVHFLSSLSIAFLMTFAKDIQMRTLLNLRETFHIFFMINIYNSA